jgi:hypothetical protein
LFLIYGVYRRSWDYSINLKDKITMTLRIAHIIIVLSVTILFFGFIYVGDYFFKERYNERDNRYNRQFSEIKTAMADSAYHRAILICEQIIADDGTGLNEVKAKVYIGLAQLKMDQPERSIATLGFLVEKYPGIKAVYGDLFRGDKSKDNLTLIYDDIITSYAPSYSESINSEMTIEDINGAMQRTRGHGRLGGSGWMAFILLQIAAIGIYERFRKSRGAE